MPFPDVVDSAAQLLPQLVVFRDLRRANIAKNWTQLGRLIKERGFPAGRMTSANTRTWTVEEIKGWYADCPVEQKKLVGAAAKRHAARIASTTKEGSVAA